MRLLDYLEDHDLTLAAFGARIGRTPATVSRIARGVNPPDSETIRRIFAATEGAVTANDFFDDAAA